MISLSRRELLKLGLGFGAAHYDLFGEFEQTMRAETLDFIQVDYALVTEARGKGSSRSPPIPA